MKADRIQPDLVAYNALASAYMNSGKSDMAFELWNEMCGKANLEITGRNGDENSAKPMPDIITLTNVIATLERAEGTENLKRMDIVFQDAVERKIIFGDTMDTKWEIDLSGMSLPVARASCRYILNQLSRTATESEVEDLMLITGVGKHHQQYRSIKEDFINIDDGEESISKRSRTALREYVRQVLRQDFEPPLFSVIPSNAAGIVQINKNVLMQWMREQR